MFLRAPVLEPAIPLGTKDILYLADMRRPRRDSGGQIRQCQKALSKHVFSRDRHHFLQSHTLCQPKF